MRPTISHLFIHIKNYGRKHEALYLVAIMLFFWSVFNGIFAYSVPIIIAEHGYSDTELGFICGFSSFAGAIWDFVMSRYFVRTNYIRYFLYMFLASFCALLFLYLAEEIFMFLLVMALWGIFFDFMSIGSFDFIGRHTSLEEHTSSNGVLDIFKSLGVLMAPLLAGFLLRDTASSMPYLVSAAFLVISVIMFSIVLIQYRSNADLTSELQHKRVNFLTEFHLWEKIGKKLLPILILTFFLNMFDAFFWTIGPLYSLHFVEVEDFGGILLTSYMVPLLITGWFVGGITKKYGKKRTAYVALLASSLSLLPLLVLDAPLPILLTTIVAAFFITISWPALRGAYADYISETKAYDKEIEGIGDFFSNLGYVVGPILAGILAGILGLSETFGVLGILGILVSLILIKITPQKIVISDTELD